MAVEGYHDATIVQAIIALDANALIEEINKLSVDNNCRISICHHTDDEKHNEINFIVELIDGGTVTTIFNKANISAHISDSLNYDNVTVNFRHFYSGVAFEKLFEDVTPFIPENYVNIHAFFQKHYPECYQEPHAVAHQDKRQRPSTSTSSSSSSLFLQGSHQGKAVNPPSEDMVTEYLLQVLQQAPWWNDLMGSPEGGGVSILDKGYEEAKRLLNNGQVLSKQRR